jgi:hypothetical protein
MASMFGWMSVIYGPIQLHRILSQSYSSAVLDQWITLPIFAWVVVWARHLSAESETGDSQTEQGSAIATEGVTSDSCPLTVTDLAIMTGSVASYGLVLLLDYGFEVALGCHIAAAVGAAVCCYRRQAPIPAARRAFIKGAFCCAGFVGLKLLDQQLANLHPFFSRVSGHFLSKICDVLQIHYSLQFFDVLSKQSRLRKKLL